MDNIFTSSENIKTSDYYKLLLNLSRKINLKQSNKYVALSNIRIYYTWKLVQKPYKNNKCKISCPTLDEIIELPDGSFSPLDFQQCFKYII